MNHIAGRLHHVHGIVSRINPTLESSNGVFRTLVTITDELGHYLIFQVWGAI